jgi:predicted DNA-binding transcriptional regulator AlpA
MNGLFISQNELAQRWQISESTLVRWRTQRIGPSFMKLGGQVRYRLMDITAFEDQTLQVMSLQKPDVDSQNRRCSS